LTGAAITVLAFAEPFIAAGAAVAFWFFFATEKELSPRGYERNEIMNAWWVPLSIREISYLMKIRFLPLAKIICVFCLETKGTKSSRKNDASTAQGKTPGPPFFHPTARIFCFI
jgi:hypothetical protein